MKEFKGPSMQRGFLGFLLKFVAPVVVDKILGGKAVDKQVEGGQDALNAVSEVNKPFLDAANQTLQPAIDSALAGPNFDLSADSARKDILNMSAAGGKLLSGGTLDALQRNRMEFENLRQGTQFDQLFRLASLGQNSSTNVSNTLAGLHTGIGATKAAGSLRTGSSLGGAVSGFLDSEIGGKLIRKLGG